MRLFFGSGSNGDSLELVVPGGETVDGLRTRLSRQLNVHTDKIVILHKDKQLTAGKLLEQGVADGSTLTLHVENALFTSSCRIEKIVEVLEKLTESEISDFLSGRSPVVIQLGMGAHTMHVQLQLSPQDVAKLQLDKAPEAPGEVNTGRSPSHANAARPASSQLATVAHSVTSMDRHCRAASHHSCPHAAVSTPSFPSACPRAATALTCVRDAIAAPQSPLTATTFRESFHPAVEPSKQPGAVIESLVKHSQGVFSGTFSGTLVPCNQSSDSHHRRGVSIILQILDDLLRAASQHPRAPTSLRPASDPLTQERRCGAELVGQAPAEEAQQSLTTSKENQTLHCKLKHLQSLLDQRRHHRRTRRSTPFSQKPHPYQRNYCP
ncbi:midnolin-like [Corythoichthys intestinalis]|uniref:midnolin-like n=1 Tax=Corythoichthys intestinalis TaxID=161448 RepID=UPI0025A5B3A5|nr:midnolin-like [Corythoichthys intestinalis]XP_057713626.1 midnolin-like [Corythoichthys intestinalis]XP_061794970.1 midnolin-like [Nerophis lumbriciformis]